MGDRVEVRLRVFKARERICFAEARVVARATGALAAEA